MTTIGAHGYLFFYLTIEVNKVFMSVRPGALKAGAALRNRVSVVVVGPHSNLPPSNRVASTLIQRCSVSFSPLSGLVCVRLQQMLMCFRDIESPLSSRFLPRYSQTVALKSLIWRCCETLQSAFTTSIYQKRLVCFLVLPLLCSAVPTILLLLFAFHAQIFLQASPRLKFDEALVRRVWDKIQNDEPSDTIFDEVQARVCCFFLLYSVPHTIGIEKFVAFFFGTKGQRFQFLFCKVWDMLQEDKYFPSFKKSRLYIKLLAELDLLRENSLKETESNGLEDGTFPGKGFRTALLMFFFLDICWTQDNLDWPASAFLFAGGISAESSAASSLRAVSSCFHASLSARISQGFILSRTNAFLRKKKNAYMCEENTRLFLHRSSPCHVNMWMFLFRSRPKIYIHPVIVCRLLKLVAATPSQTFTHCQPQSQTQVCDLPRMFPFHSETVKKCQCRHVVCSYCRYLSRTRQSVRHIPDYCDENECRRQRRCLGCVP